MNQVHDQHFYHKHSAILKRFLTSAVSRAITPFDSFRKHCMCAQHGIYYCVFVFMYVTSMQANMYQLSLSSYIL